VDAINNKANAIASSGESIQPAVYYGEQSLMQINYVFLNSAEIENVSANAFDNLEEAIKLYDKALSIAPNDVDILVNKGIALLKLERYTEAN
jgi:Flp pilus assembly protein TadD